MEAIVAGKKAIIDIFELTIDQSLPKDTKLLEVTRRTGNPYHFKCRGITITARYDNNAPSLENHVKRLFT